MTIGEPRQLVLPCPTCGDNKIVMARQVKKEEVETNPMFAQFLQSSQEESPPLPSPTSVPGRERFESVTKLMDFY